MKIKSKRHGRYGTYSVASIPKIAGGAGSPTSFDLAIAKNVKGAGGKTYHPIEANAPTASCRPTSKRSSPTAPRQSRK